MRWEDRLCRDSKLISSFYEREAREIARKQKENNRYFRNRDSKRGVFWLFAAMVVIVIGLGLCGVESRNLRAKTETTSRWGQINFERECERIERWQK